MENRNENKNIFYIIPAALILFLVPLIVRLKEVKLQGANYEYWKGISVSYDLFSYHKATWILILAVFTLVMLAVSLSKNRSKLSKGKYFIIPLGVYSLFVILSTLLSDHKSTALFGFTERYEGMFILLAYAALAFSMMIMIDSERNVKLLFAALFASAVVISIIGILQYFGHDIWTSDIGKKIMLGSKYGELKDKLNFEFNKNKIYASLYHYNYVGSYMAMLFPLSFTLFILSKKKLYKLITGIISLLMLANVIGSTSRAGVVGVFFAIIILIIILNKFIKNNWKGFAAGTAVLIAIVIGLNAASNGALNNRLKSILYDAGDLLSKQSKQESTKNKYFLKTVLIEGKRQVIVANDGILKLDIENDNLGFYDRKDNPIPIKYNAEKGLINFNDDRYKQYKVIIGKVKGKQAVVVERDNIKLFFGTEKNGMYMMDSKGKKIEDINNIEMWGFEGKEKIASSRGYIWSRSIPLLKHTIFLGYGPDNFTIYFPQHDILGKLNAYDGDIWQIVDKPHNLYLQIGINTGIISLIAFLAIILMYIVSSFKVYFNNTYEDFYSIAGVAIFAAVIGYLGAGFFNDSVVSVAPVFWCLLGMGISINLKLSVQK